MGGFRAEAEDGVRPEREGRSAMEVSRSVRVRHDSLTGEVPDAGGGQAQRREGKCVSGMVGSGGFLGFLRSFGGGTHSFTRHCGNQKSVERNCIEVSSAVRCLAGRK